MSWKRLVFLFASLALLGAVGCSNPASDKPEAVVSEPVESAAGDAEGKAYTLDAESKVEFTGSKLTGSHDGGFSAFTGEITVVDGDPTASRVSVEIDTTSLFSDDDRLTNHLKGSDFFDVEKFAKASFESTEIVAADGGYTITGNLDLHGVEKSISFPATIDVAEDRVTARAEFFIQRFDFAIEYKGRADDLIRDEVVIRLDLIASAKG
ncbi:MAG: YceI family protein [bacterium]|nr:YceI family protein [bacterium]